MAGRIVLVGAWCVMTLGCLEGYRAPLVCWDGGASNFRDVDLANDPEHCGCFGASCTVNTPTALPTCQNGQCSYACIKGYASCEPDSVCSTDTRTSLRHCGGCATLADDTFACDKRLNTTSSYCENGRCVLRCATGFMNCNGQTRDGCEANLSVSPMHCGMCGRSCLLRNARPNCMAGQCRATQCDGTWGNCNGDDTDGCETDLSSNRAHCGRCNTVCNGTTGTGEECLAGTCRCASTNMAWCMGVNRCANRSTDVACCGSSGTSCIGPNVASATCVDGVCRMLVCRSGFGNCDGDPLNGCEVNLNTAVNCGSCGTRCGPYTNAPGIACTNGQCAIERCDSGFGHCDTSVINGCETNLNTTANHCGRCGNVCPTATPRCVNGACVA